MRWEDERYVRFYTRNTPEWLALSWRARGLFGLLMRAVDRAGILAVGKLGPKGVATAIGAPWVEVEGPLDELLADGCVQHNGPAVVIPNFLPAQEAPQSDAARKRAQRERARAEVTKRDHMESQIVTEPPLSVTSGHVGSRPVTPSLAVPSLAELKEKPSATRKRSQREETKTGASAIAYSDAFFVRYGVRPFRDDKPDRTANSLLAQLVDKLGAEDAPGVAQHFIASNEKLYVVSKHPLNLLCRDYVKLRAEWLGAKRSTNTEAGQIDRTQSNLTAIHGAAERLKEKNRGVV